MRIRWGEISVSSTESRLSAHGCTFTVLTLYIAANTLLFLRAARTEWLRNSGYLKYIVPIARGAGQLININLAAVLTLSSRSLSSFLRETPLSLILPLDKAMPTYHSCVGVIAASAGLVHTFAQCIVYAVSQPWASGFKGKTSVFVTGVLLVIAFAIICVSTLTFLRQNHYEVFWYCHLAGGTLAFILVLLHGMNRGSLTSWKWVVGPLAIYCVDRVFRTIRMKRSYLLVAKHNAGFHGPNVVKIRLPRLFHFEAGQYAEMKVPEISSWEWHPFTIASAPHEPEMVFYVKVAGNWTNRLYQIFCERGRDVAPGDVRVHIRGPFGAPAQHVGEYDHVILIGGGVGATPFCSVTKSAQYLLEHWRPTLLKNLPKDRPWDAINDEACECSTRQSPHAESSSIFPVHIETVQTAEVDDVFPYDSEIDLPARDTDISGTGDRQSVRTEAARRSAGTDTVTMFTALDYLRMSTSSHSAVHPTRPSAAQEARLRNMALERARQTGNVQAAGALNFAKVKRDRENGNERHSARGPLASRGHSREYMEALSSAYSIRHISETYHASLNMLVGLNYGSVSLIRTAQFQKAYRDAKQVPANSRPEPGLPRQDASGGLQTVPQQRAEDRGELSVFQSPTLMFLLFMRSITMTLVTVWIICARALLLGCAAVFDRVTVLDRGLALYSSHALISTDLALSIGLFSLICMPLILEIVTIGVFAQHGLEGLLISPIVLLGVIIDVLALSNQGKNMEILGPVQVFALWPVTLAVTITRLIRVIRERLSDADDTRSRDIFTTKSLEFFWTSPTQLDDAWLVHELRGCVKSRVVRLHRYLTRETELPNNTITSTFETRLGRPNWDEIFNDAAKSAKNGTVIGVFFCGPETMSKQVQKAATQAMRNSIIRGLQTGAYLPGGMRELEELFGEAVSANEHTGEEGTGTIGAHQGCNVRFVYRKEKFN